MEVPARHWRSEENGKVRCQLCPHACLIDAGGCGKCLIRKNKNGSLVQSAYAMVTSAAVDPIEKKPLYHFHPGSNILSVGTNGCNMACKFCQNWQISAREVQKQETSPKQLLNLAKENGSIGIAYTYNEPTIWFEFVCDCAEVFKESGLKNVIVSNGMISPKPLREMARLIDAANIDLKGFTEDFYLEHGGFLSTVKKSIEILFEAGVHLELTNLVIPTKNDDIKVFEEMCKFIAGISRDVPLHLSRYFPQYKYSFPPTPNKTLTELAETARKHLSYVYIGNADISGWSDTRCPECGAIVIKRSGYKTAIYTDKNTCPACSHALPLLF